MREAPIGKSRHCGGMPFPEMAYVIIAANSLQSCPEPGYESRSFLSEELNDRALCNPRLYFPSSLSARNESPPVHWISEKAGMVPDTVAALEGKNEGRCVDDAHPRHAQQTRPTLSGNTLDSCEDTNARSIKTRSRRRRWATLFSSSREARGLCSTLYSAMDAHRRLASFSNRRGTPSPGARLKIYQGWMRSLFRIIIYDRPLDNHTLSTLFKRTRLPHIFAPPDTKEHFESIGVPNGHAHTLDWWDARRVELPGTSLKVTCTSAQYFTG
ncbi:hypothetical protein EV421DRAFT_1841018 [Armillaria borealis]|uniref:Uncharacterized protein n=1 Tax=Armillaria borealis TaxID=47425 RepID=A0AA39MHR7_9AGAR|nr:hypothetical protein EV421DRAFT_1841018 [Armillaria borealis]